MNTLGTNAPATNGDGGAAHPTPDAIMQLGMGFWGSKTLLSAVELGLFSALAGGPLGADDLAARFGLHRRSARDFFDALVSLGMLEREDGRYRNTPTTGLFLDRARPSYVGGLLEMARRGYHELVTQMYFAGETLNDADRLLLAVPEGEREKLVVAFADGGSGDVPGVRRGVFNIVLQRVA